MTNVYNKEFYANQASGSLRSASNILEIFFNLCFKPSSIIDVGCGTGMWLLAALNKGINDVAGVEYSNHAEDLIAIPKQSFYKYDISSPFLLSKKFDLCLSLEVAEHLDASMHDIYLQNLVNHSDVVLFSAAIPYQGGTGHVSENWPSYWGAKFSALGYVCFDILRGEIWNSPGINFWYKQNILIFVRKESLTFKHFENFMYTETPLSLIHPEMFLWAIRRANGISKESYEADVKYYLNSKDNKITSNSEIPKYGMEFNNEF